MSKAILPYPEPGVYWVKLKATRMPLDYIQEWHLARFIQVPSYGPTGDWPWIILTTGDHPQVLLKHDDVQEIGPRVLPPD